MESGIKDGCTFLLSQENNSFLLYKNIRLRKTRKPTRKHSKPMTSTDPSTAVCLQKGCPSQKQRATHTPGNDRGYRITSGTQPCPPPTSCKKLTYPSQNLDTYTYLKPAIYECTPKKLLTCEQVILKYFIQLGENFSIFFFNSLVIIQSELQHQTPDISPDLKTCLKINNVIMNNN